MICPHCGTEQSDAYFCGVCGRNISGESLSAHQQEVIKTHARNEAWRNTKGLAGFGCLTLYFVVGALMMLSAAFDAIFPALRSPQGQDFYGHPIRPRQNVENPIPAILAMLFFLAIAYAPSRAMIKRWKRRRHYAAILNDPPDRLPPRAPGLSEKQYQKEVERLEAVNQTVFIERKASGEIETETIQPLPEEIRAQHVWIPGIPGYGKSTLMHWMAMQDIASGKGITIIDPAGDLIGNGLPDDPAIHVEGIIDWIPSSRRDETIYIDLKQPVAIDFFGYADEDEKQTVVTNLVDLFTRLAEMFGGQPGVRFGGILRDILYTLFEAGNTSFIDIYDFIKDPERREAILASVSAKTRAQWDRFPNDEKTEPIISRLTPIAKNPRLRTIFGTPNAKLRIADVMNGGKILLVNIAGAPEAGVILGTMIISQLVQAAFRRAEMPRQKRVPHHVYCDEFHNFTAGADFARILTQCRKFNLCLTVANQYTAQLPSSLLSAVLGGTSTWFLFRMSPQDIPIFRANLPTMAYQGVWEKRHPDDDLPDWAPDFIRDKNQKPVDTLVGLKPLPFDPQILAQLQVGEAIHRRADATAVKVRTFPMGKRPVASFARLIRERTIAQYAVAPIPPPPDRATKGGDGKPDHITSQKRKGSARKPDQGKAAGASG